MKVAVAGFSGERLKEAIEVRNITKTALAEMAGVSAGLITQYEKGTSTPQITTLVRLCSVLGFPQSFFVAPALDPPAVVFWRSFASTTLSARKRSRWRLAWTYNAHDFLSKYIEFPKVDLPKVRLPDNYRELTPKVVEEIAQAVRDYWDLGTAPISNMVWLLENKGVVVSRNSMHDESIDAFSCWNCNLTRPSIFLASDKTLATRSRFDAAHELGHLILHKNVSKDILTHKTELKEIESQADRFAGAFLLPKDSFTRDLRHPSLDDFVRLKSKWKVSVRAMIMRAKQLSLCYEDEAKYLFMSANKRWGAKREPLDDLLQPESPLLLPHSIEALIRDGIITKHDLLAALPYNPIDMSQIFGLDEEFFQEHPPEPKLSSGDRSEARILEIERLEKG